MSDGSIFLTYLHADSDFTAQILIWASTAGAILREDTLDLSNIVYVFPDGPNAVLVEREVSQPGEQYVIESRMRPYAPDGSALPVVDLFNTTLPVGWQYAGSAFDYTDDQMLMLLATVDPDTVQNEYRLRIVRRVNGTTIVHDEWAPGPVPVRYYGTYWSVGRGPWGTGTVGYLVARFGYPQQVWVQAFGDNGLSSGGVHVVPVPEQNSCNGVSVLATETTAYACFSTTPLPGGTIGGAYLTGFPLNEILETEVESTLPPSSFILSAYPNPFNATVRLDYEIATASQVRLTVYDLTGREVSTLASAMKNTGRHSISWTAEGLPSGVYLARLSTDDMSITRKLLLLK